LRTAFEAAANLWPATGLPIRKERPMVFTDSLTSLTFLTLLAGLAIGIFALVWFLRKPGRLHPLEAPPETEEDRARQARPDSTGPRIRH
jgi:hypothetical protein